MLCLVSPIFSGIKKRLRCKRDHHAPEKTTKDFNQQDINEINGLSGPLRSLKEATDGQSVQMDLDKQKFPWWSVRDFDDSRVIVKFHLIGSRAGEESAHLDDMSGQGQDSSNPWSRERSWSGSRKARLQSLAGGRPGGYERPTAGPAN
ncbi:Hypothetical predicted protein [Marmota monax]|uniref:Uncharacterized protein n=1 Tax=Marmota monax TaxID=9995 RepID=A0A5E4CFS0_MARMO|nr:hypothetical protein GHT09_003758 [Marmota monax]VTJ80160.1 Hypothetical predicted protein [Marmota monax]